MAYAEKRGKGEFPWRVKWAKPGGGEDSASGFRTQKDALNHGREQEADIRRGRYRDPAQSAMTLDEYWEKWYPLQAPGWAKATRDNKKGQYNNHLKPRWGALPMAKIDPIEVKEFEADLREQGKHATANLAMILLRSMMADAVADRRLEFSPVAPKRRGGRANVVSSRKGIVTTLEKVEAICVRLKPQARLLVLVALFTGMRWGEVIALRRSYLRLTSAANGKPASGYCIIDPEVGAIKTRDNRKLGTTKTYRGRIVELPPFLVELLLDFIADLPAEQDLVFTTKTGRPIIHTDFNEHHWRPACDGRPAVQKAKGRPAKEAWESIEFGLWFHDLRHTHKTWLAEDGIEKAARDERLGHVGEGMDGVYIHATPAMRAKILKSLQRRWEKLHPRERRSPKRLPNGERPGRSTA